MNNIILHIPHSSLHLPNDFWENTVCEKSVVDEFNYNITDLYTDELFNNAKYRSIVAPYSRIYCDVERFAEDDKEIMSKFGMGFIYTHTNTGKRFFESNEDYRQKVFNNYYKKLHSDLDRIIENSITKNTTILLDCHSFSKDIIMFADKKENLPDICIGFDNIYYSEELVNFIKNYFENCGYRVSLNNPYLGTMIPDKYIENKIDNMYCVMIEINKKIYLKDNYQKNENFNNLQKQIDKLLNKLEYFNLTSCKIKNTSN